VRGLCAILNFNLFTIVQKIKKKSRLRTEI